MAYQWGPIWWPGIYDYWSNWPSIKFIIFFLVYITFRFYSASKPRFFYSKKRLDGKTALITGADSGIGKETAKELVRRGCHVILACKEKKKAESAKNEMLRETKKGKISVYELDLASFQSVRNFADKFISTETQLDFLIHNAAFLSIFKTFESEDFIEKTMAVNYFSPFLLTHLLINFLKKQKSCRIVFMSSPLWAQMGDLNTKNLNAIHKYPWKLYLDSKFAVHCFAQELSERLKETKITVNCVNPGAVNSPFYRNVPRFIDMLGFKWFRNRYWKTPLEGCQSVLYSIISEELEEKTGKYIVNNRIEPVHRKALDEEFNKEVWIASAKIVNLRPSDPKIL